MKPLIAIITCHKFKSRADSQRNTWIPLLKELPDKERIDYKFFLGVGSDRPPLDDEIFLDVPDDYLSLPYKTRAVMKWAVDHGYDAVLKCDDDTYIFPERLVNAYPKSPYEGRLNNSMHKIAPQGWCSGFAYWLANPALEIIANAPEPDHTAEDLWVGKTLSRNGIKCKVQHQFQVLSILPKDAWKNLKNQVVAALAPENGMEIMHEFMRRADPPLPPPPAINNMNPRIHRVFPLGRRPHGWNR